MPLPSLQELGFTPKRAKYYLGFKIKNLEPVKDLDPNSFVLRGGRGTVAPYFTTLKNLKSFNQNT